MYHTAIVKLGRAATNRSVKLRQTYVRAAKKAATVVSRYAHARQFKRMRRKLRKLRTWFRCAFSGVNHPKYRRPTPVWVV